MTATRQSPLQPHSAILPATATPMTPFQYIDFYDFPRTIAIKHKGTFFLLQSAFDENHDDYEKTYTIYALPDSVETHLAQRSWKFLEELPAHHLGQIPIESVRFDPTRRKQLDASILHQFVP
jgi:hypothetical protein